MKYIYIRKYVYVDGENVKPSIEARVMYFYLCLLDFTTLIMPFAVITLLILNPCMPPFILSTFHCAEISWMSPGPEIWVVLFEAWMALQLSRAGPTWVFCILFPGIVAILDYFQLIIRSKIRYGPIFCIKQCS